MVVDRLLEHPDIEAVSFVGSTPIAKYIYATGTANGKRVQALGGAKNHMVVLPDADIDMAADAAVSAAYGSAGERCMAISVAVAVGDAGDRLVEAIKERLPLVKIGNGLEPESEMGPLVTREHRDKVAGYLDSRAGQGATIVEDGREHGLYRESDGFFLGVSLIDHVTTDMDAYSDEIFGPVLEVMRVDTYDEALRLVNENPYGNGTAIFTRDGGAARAFQFDVQAGMVGVERADPGAGGLLLVRRLEGLAVRRQPHVRARGHQLLHEGQGRHRAMARPGHVERRPGLPEDPMMADRDDCCGARLTAGPRCWPRRSRVRRAAHARRRGARLVGRDRPRLPLREVRRAHGRPSRGDGRRHLRRRGTARGTTGRR